MSTEAVRLHTRGARSGDVRVVTVTCFPDGDDILLVGGGGGSPSHPAWVHNLRANPNAAIEADSAMRQMTARELTGDEHASAWRTAVALNPQVDQLQATVDRVIPVFRLTAR